VTDESGAEGPLTVVASGDQLVLAREQRGFVKSDVAQRLKLHARQLDAIERGDWNALPGRAFARGAVRSYGRLLGVDVEPLLATIGGFAEAEDLKPQSSLAAPMPRGGAFGFDGEGRSSRWPWALLGVLGVVAVALFFGRDGDVSSMGSWMGSPDPRPASTGTSGSGAPGAPPSDPGSGSGPAAGVSGGAPGVPPPLVLPPLVPPAPAPGSASATGRPVRVPRRRPPARRRAAPPPRRRYRCA
jgi:cytoskeleton protein RodZ